MIKFSLFLYFLFYCSSLFLITEKELKIAEDSWTTRGGIWDFSDSIYYAQGTQRNNKAYYNKKTIADFIFEIKMTKLTEDGSYGIIFRYNEKKDDGYVIELWPHGGYVLSKYQHGIRHIISNKRIKNYNKAVYAWNKLSVKCIANSITIHINGQLLITVKDTLYKSGRIGLFIGGGPRQQARFKILKIQELN
ncbi:MAG: DUF1080 domain-containing protein [Bacteroidetes bacterium]|nr:DUF1080 domain-containing protein [Bacteroidota bacterium]